MSEWKPYKIREIGKVITGNTPSSKFPEHWGEILPFITPTDFDSYNKSIFHSIRSLSNSGVKSLEKKLLPKNSVLVTCIGSQMGKVAVNMVDCITNQQINSIIPFPDFDHNFLYYSLSSKKDYLRNLATGGSTMPIVNKTDFENIELSLPPLPTQKAIAEILSSLDDKIELNNQINQNLEALAQALFKQWFIDFEFPNENGEPYKSSGGEMVDSELGEIPKGWEISPLSQIIEVKHGYAFKGEFFSDSETDNILVTPGNFKIGGGFNYGKFKFYEGDFPKDYLLNFEDLIVTMTDLSKEGDTLGYPALVPKIRGKKLLHNQRIGKVIFKENPEMKIFLYMLMRTVNYRSFVLSGASGTTVRHTSPSRICEFKSVMPPYEILESFREVIAPLFRTEAENNFENNLTSNLRDTLLPKLISGELEVNESLLEQTF